MGFKKEINVIMFHVGKGFQNTYIPNFKKMLSHTEEKNKRVNLKAKV